MNRAAFIALSRDAHEQVGRGMVVMLREDKEPRYVSIEDAKARLVEQGVEPDLLHAVVFAVRKYEPRWECVLFLETEECGTVSIIGHDRSEVVGSVSWTPVH